MPERALGTSPRPLFQPREPVFRRASGCTPRRQASEQYRTRSQSRSHFLRQEKGRAQAAQTLVGKWAFFMRRWLAGPGAQETFPKVRSWTLDREWSGRHHLGWHPFMGWIHSRGGRVALPQRCGIVASWIILHLATIGSIPPTGRSCPQPAGRWGQT